MDYPKNTRKWHLSQFRYLFPKSVGDSHGTSILDAYYTQETVDQLDTVDDIPELRTLYVPDGAYICARTSSQRRNARAAQKRSLDESTESQLRPLHPYQYDRCTPPLPPSASPPPQQWSPLTNAILPTRDHSPRAYGDCADRQLAPLEYLQNIPPSSRNPVDDEILKSFRRRL